MLTLWRDIVVSVMRADYSTSQQTDYSRHLKPVWQLDKTGSEVADVTEREDQESLHDRRDG